MLRDFTYTLDPALLMRALGRFDVAIPDEKYKLALIEFQVLTPDSSIWRFLIDGEVYYLYAEDFVEGLMNVRSKVSSYAVRGANLDFIKVKQQEVFNDAEPVKNAAVYLEPENSSEMMQYAVGSGYDFVFLCKSDEDANHALFNGERALHLI